MLGNFFIIVALVLMLLSFKSVIYTLLISKAMSEKLYKNFGLALLCFGATVFGSSVLIWGMDCTWYLETLKQKTVLACAMEAHIENLLRNLDYMTIGTVMTVAFYVSIRLLIKNIEKDVKLQKEQSIARWGPLSDRIF